MTPSEQTAHEIRKTHNFQLKRGYKANYACTYCGVEMIGDSRAGQPCKNANLFVINEELNLLPWEPPLRTARHVGLVKQGWPLTPKDLAENCLNFWRCRAAQEGE